MHRQPVLALLAEYERRHSDECAVIARLREFVQQHSDCHQRSCLSGHLTASSWIVAPDRSRFLLTHHRRLGRWLQLGGHLDGELDPAQSALREAMEESGLAGFHFLPRSERPVLLDIDIHPIPAYRETPAHFHYDLRYLLQASSDDIAMSDESLDLRWFAAHELNEVLADESVLRLWRKAAAVLARG
ncbi:MAG: NUDIX hydrolase [Planctomycetota bacterium]